MAYVRTNWVDDVTPVNAENLNNLEDGVQELQIDPTVIELLEELGIIVREE